MGSTNYPPRRNNYQPLRDQEQKTIQQDKAREASELNQPKQTQAQQREEERPGRPAPGRVAGLTPGGPLGGGLEASQTYANAELRARAQHESAHARTPIDQRLEEDKAQNRAAGGRTPIEQRVRENAEKQHELADSTVQRSNVQEREV